MDIPRPRVPMRRHSDYLPKPSVPASAEPHHSRRRFDISGLPCRVLGLVIFGDLPVWERWVGIGLISSDSVCSCSLARTGRKLRSRVKSRRGARHLADLAR